MDCIGPARRAGSLAPPSPDIGSRQEGGKSMISIISGGGGGIDIWDIIKIIDIIKE